MQHLERNHFLIAAPSAVALHQVLFAQRAMPRFVTQRIGPAATGDRVADVPPKLSSRWAGSPIPCNRRLDVKKGFTEEQIIGSLREAEMGLPVAELCRRHGF